MECLKTIAIFRIVNPQKNILAQGGREYNLRQLQPLALMSGANGLLLGNYLLTSGRNPELDLELISDLGFETNNLIKRFCKKNYYRIKIDNRR